MVVTMYSLYDKKTEVYGLPFCAHNDWHALRMVGDDVEAKRGVVSQHPEDFVLYAVATYDDSKGKVVGLEPRSIMDVVNLVKGGSEDA